MGIPITWVNIFFVQLWTITWVVIISEVLNYLYFPFLFTLQLIHYFSLSIGMVFAWHEDFH
jgi:hypothetical protein